MLRAAPLQNVIIFLVDDLGWTDVGCFGSDFIETPNIDRLALGGIRFTQAYAACTVCSPSRAALLTGQSPARLHLTDFIPGHPIGNTPMRIPEWTQVLKHEHRTLAELLKPHGYATAHLGKWHLSHRKPYDQRASGEYDPTYAPQSQGFDVNVGGCELGAPASYFWPYGRGKDLTDKKENSLYRTLPPGGKQGEYLTDRLALEAEKLVDRFADQPFFINMSFYNVHTPLQGPPNLVKKYREKFKAQKSKPQHRNPIYAAMVESVDQAVGRIMAKLDEKGLTERTVIIFTSDNGGLDPQATDNAPLRQGKGSIYEGGVRVPTIICAPGVAPKNYICSSPVITMDFLPTVMELLNKDIPKEVKQVLDGESLLPQLKKPKTARTTPLFWHYPHYHMMGARPYSAVRQGSWKLIELYDPQRSELYNLDEDIHEDSNLALQHPEKTEALRVLLTDWKQSVDAQGAQPNTAYQKSKKTGWSYPNGRYREPAALRKK
jgi:arylsulfatase A-like enzyme